MTAISGRDMSRQSLGAVCAERRDSKRRKFAVYGRCPECRAFPANPCRERSLAGTWVVLDRPHLARPKVEETA